MYTKYMKTVVNERRMIQISIRQLMKNVKIASFKAIFNIFLL